MIALYKKEISLFFSSLVGYIVIGIYLILSGLFLWIFQSGMNIVNSGFANLDGLFALAPWVFLFLVPAVTMRMLSEEYKTGTLELLITHPISNVNIILAKFSAALTLVFIALLPTLLYYHTVYSFGDPTGNIDGGATLGAYIGLLFLSCIYVAVGIFASTLTSSQIVAFILGMFLCFFLFSGFENIGLLIGGSDKGLTYVNFGINEHYKSISRGVVDFRDVFYFISVTSLFITLSVLTLSARKK